MLVRMTFDLGLPGELWQEVIDGTVTRWFDDAGDEIELPAHVAYHAADVQPEMPAWYVAP